MELKKLFEFEILQNEDVEIPGTSEGDLLISPTSGGSFRGDELNGKLLPVGIGTTYTHGTENDIHSHTLLRTDDGCDILMDPLHRKNQILDSRIDGVFEFLPVLFQVQVAHDIQTVPWLFAF